MSRSPREAAFKLLFRFEKPPAEPSGRLKADALIQSLRLTHTDWSEQDAGFFHALVMLSLRHWHVWNTMMVAMAKRRVKDISPQVRTLFRMGLTQKLVMPHIPDYAAIDATMDLAPAKRLSPKDRGFLHACLQKVDEAAFQDALKSSLPTWLKELLPENECEMLAAALLASPRLGVRVNTLKTTVADYLPMLEAVGIVFEQPEPVDLPECVLLSSETTNPLHLPGFADGLVSVQDVNSARVVGLLNPQAGWRVLDACAAPGSKTTHLAARMSNDGEIIALDPTENRVTRLKENLARLGVTCVSAHVSDLQDWSQEALGKKLFDAILIDAPCSGLGTVRRHPDILVQTKAAHLETYPPVQLALLNLAPALLKVGGVLAYSTCTINPGENERVVEAFLEQAPGMKLETMTRYPVTAEADGFFMARLIRQG